MEVFKGIYLNPGNDMFAETVRGEIYVDKTGLIEQIYAMVRTPQKFICISRPRRFGKSTAAYMLADIVFLPKKYSDKPALLVGINYDKKTKTHTCIIEKADK